MGSPICAVKFYDANADGIQNNGEAGIANWKITLSGTNISTRTGFTGSDGTVYVSDFTANKIYAIKDGTVKKDEIIAGALAPDVTSSIPAFNATGFQGIGAFDDWDPAVRTYRANFDEPVSRQAISEQLALPEATVIVGGPPCQGFSSAGMRRNGDHRNSLVSVFAQLIAAHRPLAFVFENVEGFVTGEGGRFVFELLDPVIGAGYRVHVRKINAANFGVLARINAPAKVGTLPPGSNSFSNPYRPNLLGSCCYKGQNTDAPAYVLRP